MKFRSCDFAPSHGCFPCLENPVKTDLGNTRRQERSARSMKQTQRYGEGWKRALVILMLIQWEWTQQGRDVFCKDPFSWDSLGRKSGFLAVHHMWEIPAEYNRALLVFCVLQFLINAWLAYTTVIILVWNFTGFF